MTRHSAFAVTHWFPSFAKLILLNWFCSIGLAQLALLSFYNLRQSWANFGKFWRVKAGSRELGQFWTTLDGLRQFWTTLGNSGQLWAVFGNSGQLWAILDNSGRSSVILDNSGQSSARMANSIFTEQRDSQLFCGKLCQENPRFFLPRNPAIRHPPIRKIRLW